MLPIGPRIDTIIERLEIEWYARVWRLGGWAVMGRLVLPELEEDPHLPELETFE